MKSQSVDKVVFTRYKFAYRVTLFFPGVCNLHKQSFFFCVQLDPSFNIECVPGRNDALWMHLCSGKFSCLCWHVLINVWKPQANMNHFVVEHMEGCALRKKKTKLKSPWGSQACQLGAQSTYKVDYPNKQSCKNLAWKLLIIVHYSNPPSQFFSLVVDRHFHSSQRHVVIVTPQR